MTAVDAERQFRRCPTPNRWTGSSCKRRGCPVCGIPWARNWATSTRVNLDDYIGVGGAVVMISVTPPGIELLPWACTKDHDHGPKHNCKVVDEAADAWSKRCTDNWRRLRDAARKRVKAAGLPTETLVLERVWEPQNRGVPHLHVISGAATELEAIAAQRFAEELADLAPQCFFGIVDRGKRVKNQACPVTDHRDSAQQSACICKRRLRRISAHDAGRYLVRYFTGRGNPKKPTIRQNVAHERMPRSLIWLTPKLTSRTLVTMRRLRYARWYFAATAGRVQIYPRLFGQLLFDVARACVRIEPKKARAPGEGDEDAYNRHLENLRLMREIQPPYDSVFGPSRRYATRPYVPAPQPDVPVDPIGTSRWEQLLIMVGAAPA